MTIGVQGYGYTSVSKPLLYNLGVYSLPKHKGGKSMFEVPDGASGLKVVCNLVAFGEPKLAIWTLQW